MNTMNRPSGDQLVGNLSSLSANSGDSSPSALDIVFTNRSSWPPLRDANAIRSPPGDHAGKVFPANPPVAAATRVRALVFTSRSHISPPPATNATRDPSGDNDISL